MISFSTPSTFCRYKQTLVRHRLFIQHWKVIKIISHHFDICSLGRPGYKYYQIKQIREKKRYQINSGSILYNQSKTALALHYDSIIDGPSHETTIQVKLPCDKGFLVSYSILNFLRQGQDKSKLKGNLLYRSGAAGCSKKTPSGNVNSV